MKAAAYALLCLGLWSGLSENASAQYYPNVPQAPDACGPGYYSTNHLGAFYGPNHCVRPCFPPWNGAVLASQVKFRKKDGKFCSGREIRSQVQEAVQRQQIQMQHAQMHQMQIQRQMMGLPPLPPPTFPSHPFARSPRDFFMIGDNDLEGR